MYRSYGRWLDWNVRWLAMDLCVRRIMPPCRLVFSSLHRLDWTLFIFLGVAFIFTLFIPETLAPVLLRRKAQKIRKETGDDRYCTLEELEKIPFTEAMKVALIRPFLMLFQEPIVIFFSFCKFIANSLLSISDLYSL